MVKENKKIIWRDTPIYVKFRFVKHAPGKAVFQIMAARWRKCFLQYF